MTVCPDEIDALFDAVRREPAALDALDGAVRQLREASEAKRRLAALERLQLYAELRRRGRDRQPAPGTPTGEAGVTR